MPGTTIETFFETARRFGDRTALRRKVGGSWREWSWNAFASEARRAGRALVALGVPAGGTVSILGPNRPEWVIAAFGSMAAGATPAGIYTTSTTEQVAYITAHAESTVAVVHDAKQLAKFRAVRAELPALKHIVLMDGT